MPTHKITSKSTKSEIMKAYNELSAAYRALERDTKAVTTDDGPAPASASGSSASSSDIHIDDIIRALAGLADNFGDATRTLQHKLTTEATTLGELRAAIATHVKHLRELHGIEVGENTLEELLQSYSDTAKAGAQELQEKREALRAELEDRRTAWKKEQDEHSRATREARELLKKSRQREVAEYEYTRDQKIAAEGDARDQARAAFEAELVALREAKAAAWEARERAVADRETELADLQAKKAGHEAALAAAVKRATDEGTAIARRQAKIAADLQAKADDGQQRLYSLRIASLEETIAKQTAQVQSLTKQLSTAISQAQDLAVKAIEGASNATSFDAIREIAMEQAKYGGKSK